MMSLSSLYLWFFVVGVGAFAQPEASSAPGVVEPPAAASPVSFALLADQQQQKDKAFSLEKESPGDLFQQKKTPLAKVLAAAGTAAVILVLIFFLMKQMKGEFKPEDIKKQLEEEVKKEDEWKGKTEEEIKQEATSRFERVKDIVEDRKEEWKQYTEAQRWAMAAEEEREDREYWKKREIEKREEEEEARRRDPVAYEAAKARNRN